ncbi:Dynamin- GTPase protein [Ascosphaera pollenicola]|nr:Dynamin- GTPase protein [Ascosphaera pollenicola]
MAANAQGSSEPRNRERNSQAIVDRPGTRIPAFSSGTDAPRRLQSASVTQSREENMLEKGESGRQAIACAVIQSTVPAWLNIILIVSLIFGGCCANPRGIPLRSWIIFTAYFLTVNVLNNSAFSFSISVPLHIIVRSAGPVASMIIGYLYNSKRYSRIQIGAVMLLTAGVVGAALADANAKGKSISFSGGSSEGGQFSFKTIIGFSILGLAMVLAAFQGVFADKMYAKYGHQHWREALFYCHTLSLPFFLPALPQLIPQLRELLASPPLLDYITETTAFFKTPFTSEAPQTISHTFYSILRNSAIFPYLEPVFAHTPVKLFYLILNALTQFFCIRGVHILAAKTSSLTVVIVLNVRKLVSLMLSVYVFGNLLAPGVVAGAFTVFAAGGIYAYESAQLKKVPVRKTSVTKVRVETKEE